MNYLEFKRERLNIDDGKERIDRRGVEKNSRKGSSKARILEKTGPRKIQRSDEGYKNGGREISLGSLLTISILFSLELLLPTIAFASYETEWSPISTSPGAVPFWINISKYPQPLTISGPIKAGDAFIASWMINATGHGSYFVRIFANTSHAQNASKNVSVEIFAKGPIPNTQQPGHPFFVQSGDLNPVNCAIPMKAGDTCMFSALINATGPFGKWEVWFFANSSNPSVGRNESKKIIVEIVPKVVEEIVSKGRDAYSLEFDPTAGTVYGYVNNTEVATSLVKPEAWHHLVLTYDGSQIKLYIDGELASSTLLSGPIATNTKNLTIGKFFSGIIDEVRIYNRSLSDREIAAHYRGRDGDVAVRIILSYDRIKITGEGRFVKGRRRVCVENLGLEEGKAIVSIYAC